MEVNWSSIKDVIKEFVTEHRRMDFPGFELSELYDLHGDQELPSGINVGAKWSDDWPHEDRAGVYFIFDGMGVACPHLPYS